MKIRAAVVTRIAMLSALVVVFDYSMKFSGLKIIFPWLPFLKFDFTGIPIMLSLLTTSLPAGAITSTVTFLAISVRSGDVVGASMKALAEFSTVSGFYLGNKVYRKKQKLAKALSYILGCGMRILIMFVFTIPVFTMYYSIPLTVALSMSPLVATFNLIQGFLSIFGGTFLYEILKRRAPSIVLNKNETENP